MLLYKVNWCFYCLKLEIGMVETMDVKLVKMNLQDQSLLENLLEFYVYEFTAYLSHVQLRNDGRYGFDATLFLSDERFYSFLIRVKDEIAGFAIVEDRKDYRTIREFFVMRKFTRNGVGQKVAFDLFSMFEGNWEVHQVEKNYPAQAFWRSVIKEFTQNKYREYYNERRESCQEFMSKGTPA